jgi:hypothetical protein
MTLRRHNRDLPSSLVGFSPDSGPFSKTEERRDGPDAEVAQIEIGWSSNALGDLTGRHL